MDTVRSGPDLGSFEDRSGRGVEPRTDVFLEQPAPSGAGALSSSVPDGTGRPSGDPGIREALERQRRAGILPGTLVQSTLVAGGAIRTPSARHPPGVPADVPGAGADPGTGIYFRADRLASAAGTGGAAPRVSTPPLILCCDHRGEGLSASLAGVGPREWAIETTADPRATRRALGAGRPDLIVLDPLAEGGSAELDELESLRGEDAPVPVLVVVDSGDARRGILAARALVRGAFDLVHRGSPPEEFALRMERLLAAGAAQIEMAELRHRALHDDRTDLLRPAAFEHRLLEHFSAAERHHLSMALVIIDLDAFGRVNKDYD